MVRAVREGCIEASALRPAPERGKARRHRAELSEGGPAAVAADHLSIDPVQVKEVDGLRVFARGHLDLGAPVAEDADQRPEHEHVRRRRDVDPDAQAGGV